MSVSRIRGLLTEIRRRRGDDFNARDYLLSEPPATYHYAIQVEWIPGHGYTDVLSTTTPPGDDKALALEAAHRLVIAGDDLAWVKQVRRISSDEAKLYRGRGKRS